MKRALTIAFALLLCVLAAVSAVAQEIAATPEITDDMVNAIAKKLYCPVCENITLDTCGTAACADWRYEIRLQLEQGRTEQQIIDDFVTRFGDRVVGTPEDATLRALSLVTPWVISAGILLILGRMLLARRRVPLPTGVPPAATTAAAQPYHDLIEQDLDN
jgi:cytochrome c-type biogenesis protein CcmH